MLQDWDFPFIHRTVDSNSGCLEASVIMVYCAAFDCNANSSKNKVTYAVGLSSLRSKLCLKKQTSNRRRTAGFACFEKISDCDPDQRFMAEKVQLWVILVLKSL